MLPDPPELLPAPTHDNGRGGQLRIGNPGNRGNPNGRKGAKALATLVRASRDLEGELRRLAKLAGAERGAHVVKCECGKEVRVPCAVAGMATRDRVAYARLLLELAAEARDAGVTPLAVVVDAGGPREVAASVVQLAPGVALVAGADEGAEGTGADEGGRARGLVGGLGPPDEPMSGVSPARGVDSSQGPPS